MYYIGYGTFDATNTLKNFLIDQLVKFFLLIGQSKASEAFVASSGPHPLEIERRMKLFSGINNRND